MTSPESLAACRAALLTACRTAHPTLSDTTDWVRVDDAAACMAEWEAKLRAALNHAKDAMVIARKATGGANPGWLSVSLDALDTGLTNIRAALAAAQGHYEPGHEHDAELRRDVGNPNV